MPDTQQLGVTRKLHRRTTLSWVIAAGCLVLAVAGLFAWRALETRAPIVIAFANSMSGPVRPFGDEARVATQLYLDDINAAGGVDGHPVRLKVFDDKSAAATASANVASILDSPALAVLGHSVSATSVAAGPGYLKGHIAALAGNASSDEVTLNNPYYFRALSPNTMQAEFMAEYIQTVIKRHNSAFLRAPEINLVSSNATYGRSFRLGFTRGNDGIEPKTFLVVPGDQLEASAKVVADQLAAEPEPRIIVLGVAPDVTTPTLMAIRRRGIHSMIILASGAADDSFVDQFANEPEEKDEPGFFTGNLFAIAPMILDNTGELGQTLASQYQHATGLSAGWIAAGAQDATRVMVEAIRRAHVGDTSATLAADREKVRAALASIDSRATAVVGINGPLYFNAGREMPRPIKYGFFQNGRFVSAPLQLVRVQDPDLVDIGHEIDLGHIVQIKDDFFWLQRVVYTGIDITNLNGIDVKEGTFNAEFYLWMRYADGDDWPSQIALSDFSGSFDAGKPLQSGQEDGLDYRLWRVSGKFKANFDLHDYPFDTQALLIRLQNRDHPREQIAYAIDTFGLHLDRRGESAGSSDAFRNLQLWHVVAVRPFVDSFSVQSTLGKPELFGTANRTEYGGFDTEIIAHRNVVAFMVKTLVPLFLLAVVVFATLFFPSTLAKERTTIPVTGILTSAVLLISISNQLPALGYTVALEYIFYVFFVLCLMAMTTGFLSEILRNKKLHSHSISVDLFGRVAYLSSVALTIAIFMWKFS